MSGTGEHRGCYRRERAEFFLNGAVKMGGAIQRGMKTGD
jgi:hypothetical protein